MEVKMLIKIYKIEGLVGKDSGNPYWKLETDKGDMSCFDKPIADALWDAWNQKKEIEVDATPSKDGKYVNIRKILSDKEIAEQFAKKDYAKVFKPMRSPQAQADYEEANRNYEATMPVTTGKPQDLGKELKQITRQDYNPTSMYVSYVKDLVVSGKTVEEAISIVKQAHEAFS